MKKTLTTAAGPSKSKEEMSHLIDVINQVFGLLRINYHNQYYKAIPDDTILNQVKKLWLQSLANYSADTILKATRYLLEQQEYLPTLNQMLLACEEVSHGNTLPDVHNAYLEACQAPQPKRAYAWSHPLVYHAGAASDWFFLANSPEMIAFPVFRRHFERLQKAMIAGERFELPRLEETPKQIERQPVPAAEAHQQAQALLHKLGL